MRAPTTVATTRRVVLNASLGILGLGAAAALIVPKVTAVLAGAPIPSGTGAVANLALLFGSLMFLREAQRARSRPAAAGGVLAQAPVSSMTEARDPEARPS